MSVIIDFKAIEDYITELEKMKCKLENAQSKIKSSSNVSGWDDSNRVIFDIAVNGVITNIDNQIDMVNKIIRDLDNILIDGRDIVF